MRDEHVVRTIVVEVQRDSVAIRPSRMRLSTCLTALFLAGCNVQEPRLVSGAGGPGDQKATAASEAEPAGTVAQGAGDPAEAEPQKSEPPVEPRLAHIALPWNENEVMKTLLGVHQNLRSGGYSSVTRVDEEAGMYSFDCSGMTQWVLRRAAPRAAAASAYQLPHRPLARDFYRRIASVPVREERFGWQRIARVADARPGDVVAWIKPAVIRSPNTGHVAFIVLPPVAVPGYSNAHLVRIADSSRLLHDEDTRGDRDGFGFGTILLVSDPEGGQPVAYGWAGLRWRAFETKIAIGRPTE